MPCPAGMQVMSTLQDYDTKPLRILFNYATQRVQRSRCCDHYTYGRPLRLLRTTVHDLVNLYSMGCVVYLPITTGDFDGESSPTCNKGAGVGRYATSDTTVRTRVPQTAFQPISGGEVFRWRVL